MSSTVEWPTANCKSFAEVLTSQQLVQLILFSFSLITQSQKRTIQVVQNTMASTIACRIKNCLKCPICGSACRCISHGHHCWLLASKSMRVVHGIRLIVADCGLLQRRNRSNRTPSNIWSSFIDDITMMIPSNSPRNIQPAVC